MQMIVHNPTQGIYPATSDYVHAMEVQGPACLLYVAGTMGLDQNGVAGKSLAEQLDLIWRNIRTILASADMTVDNIVRLTSYLRDPAYAEDNAKARVKALNGRVIRPSASWRRPCRATGSWRSRSWRRRSCAAPQENTPLPSREMAAKA